MNILFGRNAQGKTNCAEAVFYLCTGTSLRIRKDKQLIKEGEECASIIAEAEGRYGNVTLGANIYENKREIFINGTKISKNADLMCNLNSVFFSPGELRLVQDGPDERRRFLNLSIAQTSRNYYTQLARYNRILEQRNVLLKSGNPDSVLATLPVWDEQLAQSAAVIIESRQKYVERLAPLAADIHASLSDGAEELLLSPERNYGGTTDEIAERILHELSCAYDKDIRMGFTSVGPHRDDLKIRLNGMDARSYASQGQTRSIALSLKLAEVEIFQEYSGEYPILILDDVMSELDLPRRKKLVSRIDGKQTIITCTHAERVLYGKDAKKIRIVDGHVAAY